MNAEGTFRQRSLRRFAAALVVLALHVAVFTAFRIETAIRGVRPEAAREITWINLRPPPPESVVKPQTPAPSPAPRAARTPVPMAVPAPAFEAPSAPQQTPNGLRAYVVCGFENEQTSEDRDRCAKLRSELQPESGPARTGLTETEFGALKRRFEAPVREHCSPPVQNGKVCDAAGASKRGESFLPAVRPPG